METPIGFVTVFAVSGSVVLIARQVHKRLVSEFMKKIEHEFSGSSRNFDKGKKKVKFVENVIEPSSNNKEYRRKHDASIKPVSIVDHHHRRHHHLYRPPYYQMFYKMEEDVTLKPKLEDTMPLNRQVLYQGILEYKTLLKGGKI